MNDVLAALARASAPLALAGLVATLFFYAVREVLRSRLIPRVARKSAAPIILLVVNRLFLLSLVALMLGFTAYVIDRYFELSERGRSAFGGLSQTKVNVQKAAQAEAKPHLPAKGAQNLQGSVNVAEALEAKPEAHARSSSPSYELRGSSRSTTEQGPSDKIQTRVLFVSHNLYSTRAAELEILGNAMQHAVVAIESASREDFADAATEGYDIVHLATLIGPDYIQFEDGEMPFRQAALIFQSKYFNPELVVIPGCDNYGLSRILRRSRARWYLVTKPGVESEITETFFLEFYSGLHNGLGIEDAYNKASLDVELKHKISAGAWFILDGADTPDT